VAFCGTPEFAEYGNWFTRVAYSHVAMTFARFTYYIAWTIGNGSTAACGLSWSGTKVDPVTKQETHMFERNTSIDVWSIETGTTAVLMLDKWNTSI